MAIPRRVWIIVPPVIPPMNGQAATAERLARGLTERGVEVAVAEALSGPRPWPSAEPPDVVHAIHMARTADTAILFADVTHRPVVATAIARDVEYELTDDHGRAGIEVLARRARVLTAGLPSAAARLSRALPWAPKPLVVPRSARLTSNNKGDIVARSRLREVPDGEPLFLWLGGLRDAKEPLLALNSVVKLRGAGVPAHLAFAGPVCDPAAGVAVSAAAGAYPRFVHQIHEVPPEAVSGLLSRAAALIDTSPLGAPSAALLEALSVGVPVVARDVEGNRALIHDGRDGLLFGSEVTLEGYLRRMAEDEPLRRAIGEAGRKRFFEERGPEKEIDGYLAAYEAATA